MLTPFTHTISLLSPVGEVLSAIREQLPFVPALIVVIVAVAAIVAVAFSHHHEVRRSFLAVFFASILVVNLVGVPVLPFMHWHKFSTVQDTERTFYDFQLVTADGVELRFDERALASVDGPSSPLIMGQMRAADDAERAVLSAYMLERSRIHREKLESRSVMNVLRFPPHNIRELRPGEVSGHADLVGLRTYERTIVIAEDGRSLVSDERTLVFEYFDPDVPMSASVTAMDAPVSAQTRADLHVTTPFAVFTHEALR